MKGTIFLLHTKNLTLYPNTLISITVCQESLRKPKENINPNLYKQTNTDDIRLLGSDIMHPKKNNSYYSIKFIKNYKNKP